MTSVPMVDNRGGLVAAIEAIYGTVTAPSEWPQTLQIIADVFGDVGSVLIYWRNDGTLATTFSPSLKQAQLDYDNGWWKHDIRNSRAYERGYLSRVDAITDLQVVSAEEMDTHPF